MQEANPSLATPRRELPPNSLPDQVLGVSARSRPRANRSFTLSEPPTKTTRTARKPVKRSKTFTGCWTCRRRCLKCDEKRPACERCLRAKISCEGYDVKLVWDAEHETDGSNVQRRAFITNQHASHPVLTSDEVSSALEQLEVSGTTESFQAGPFTVFSTRQSPEHSYNVPEQLENASLCPAFEESDLDSVSYFPEEHYETFFPDAASTELDLLGHDEGRLPTPQLMDSGDETFTVSTDETAGLDNESIQAAITMTSIREKVLPQMTSYLTFATLQERALFHYWVTVLSGRMLPAQRQDNPFRTIFIPLALTRPDSRPASSGNAALLHAIYAVSAFNQAQLSSEGDRLVALGTKHHKLALGHLRRNLMNEDETQREAILATIITISTIHVINGDSSSWRTHKSGSTVLLQSLMKQNSPPSTNTALLCQILFCINALAAPNATSRSAWQTVNRSSADWNMHWPTWHASYELERLFGISRPVLEAIVRTNALADRLHDATAEEINELDVYIRCNDPSVALAGVEGYDDIICHHAGAFFCACLLYFERRLRNTDPNKIQRIVQRSLYHLETVRNIEKERSLDVCGIFWPEFITACEAAEANDVRTHAICLFNKGDLSGIGNMKAAEQVVLEVWRRRDIASDPAAVHWHDVMADLGLDLILT